MTARHLLLTALASTLLVSFAAPPVAQSLQAVPDAVPQDRQIAAVTLENFSGEGSFMDGYDFSAGAVQRYGENGADRPELQPDFYFSESYPVTNPNYWETRKTIDYGPIGLGGVTAPAAPNDPRWGENRFLINHTYGLFTADGSYVALRVTNLYEEPYDDWYVYGLTFEWKTVGAPPVGDLSVAVSSDKSSYNQGEHPRITIRVTVAGTPTGPAQICFDLFAYQGGDLWGLCFETDNSGAATQTLTYGDQIPSGTTGQLGVEVEAYYGDVTAAGAVAFSYGQVSEPEPPHITISTDRLTYLPGQTMEIRGKVTQDGDPVPGTDVTLTAYDGTGNSLAAATRSTDGSGNHAFDVTPPPSFTGRVRLTVAVTVDGQTDSAEVWVSVEDGSLELELTTAEDANWGPGDPIAVGDTVGFGGTVTSGGGPVAGASITIVLNGATHTTTTDREGQFSYYVNTAGWDIGDYTIRITATSGSASVDGEIPFELVADSGSLRVVLNLAAYYPVGQEMTIGGRLTGYGQPVESWLEFDVVAPDGTVQSFAAPTNANGEFALPFTPSQLGEYEAQVLSYTDGVRVGSPGRFEVTKTGGPPTTLPPPPPPAEPIMSRHFRDVSFPETAVTGEPWALSGRLEVYEDGRLVGPQAGWLVSLCAAIGCDPTAYASPPQRWQTTTDTDGAFAFDVSLAQLDALGFRLCAMPAEGEPCEAVHFDRVTALLNVAVTIELEYTEYYPGEPLTGTVQVAPTADLTAEDWASVGGESRLTGLLQIEGPDDDPSLYTVEIHRWSADTYFAWKLPPGLDPGYYTVRAYVSGPGLPTAEGETRFFLSDTVPADVTAWVVVPQTPGIDGIPVIDPWGPVTLAGIYRDYQDAPIPGAEVRVEAVGTEGSSAQVTLRGTTDDAGRFEISLEPLDLATGGNEVWWTIVVYADKEGYATGGDVLNARGPFRGRTIEILSFTPNEDVFSSAEPNYGSPVPFSATLHVRYNALSDDDVISVIADGNWAIDASKKWRDDNGNQHCDGDKWYEVSINDESFEPRDWYTFGRRNMPCWYLPGQPGCYAYNRARYSVAVPVGKGINQEQTVTVTGTLFDLPYEQGHSSCGAANLLPESASLPPPWAVDPSITVRLGNSDSVTFPLGEPPQLRAEGSAWVAGEEHGSVRVQLAVGRLPLAGKTVRVEAVRIERPTGDDPEEGPTERPVPEVITPDATSTDAQGNLAAPLGFRGDTCDPPDDDQIFIKITIPGVEEGAMVPLVLRCEPEVTFSVRPSNGIVTVQTIGLTDDFGKSVRLVSGKHAGVRVYVDAEGEIYQPSAARVDLRLTVKVGGRVQSVQTKTLSLTRLGASVSGWGEMRRWDPPPPAGQKEGRQEGIPVDFVFTPKATGSDEAIELEVVLDPQGAHGKQQTFTQTGVVKRMRKMFILFVPVDIENIDPNFVAAQARFVEETFPVPAGGVRWRIARNFPTAEMYRQWELSGDIFTWLGQIALNLGERYASAEGTNFDYRIVGVVAKETWALSGMAADAIGAQFGNNVTLLLHPRTEENNLAHELGHTYGLYQASVVQKIGQVGGLAPSEQYDLFPDNGQPLGAGLILRNGTIYEIPEDLGNADTLRWQAAFGKDPEKIGSHVASGKKYFYPEVFDLMGNAGDGGLRAWVTYDTYTHLFDELMDPPGSGLLLVQGRIGKDGTAELAPVRSLDGRPADPGTEGAYSLELRTSSGAVLHRTQFDVNAGGTSGLEDVVFQAHLPNEPGTASIVLLHEDRDVASRSRSADGPIVTVDPPIPDADDRLHLGWEAIDVDGDQLTYAVSYRCDEDGFWFPLGANLFGSAVTFDMAGQPGGRECWVQVAASDGFNTAIAVSEPFRLPDQAPLAMITTPAETDEGPWTSAETITLRCLAYDPEQGSVRGGAIRWWSSLDGPLGTGDVLAVRLSPGEHEINLEVVDGSGGVQMTSIAFTVAPAEGDGEGDGTGNGPAAAPVEEAPADNGLGLAVALIAVALGVVVLMSGAAALVSRARKRS